MEPMIYHYTTIKTLALILKNKTIRFNRLDHVDDVEETMYSFGYNNSHVGQYAFVSCWTKYEKEKLPLWKMYSGYEGVRIGLEQDMFPCYMYMDKHKCLTKAMIETNSKYFMSCLLNPYKLFDIEYIDNVEERVADIVQLKGENVNIATRRIGIYKSKEWEFQQECRYKLILLPMSDIFRKTRENVYQIKTLSDIGSMVMSLICTNTPLCINHYDLPLNEEKLQHIEVTLGPKTTEGDRFIVESLLKNYPDAVIKDSQFKGKLR